jgi:uncharacterized DUF497 family protein
MTGSFEWDAIKEESNLVKHKVDFRRAIEIFDGDVVEIADIRRDYGEVRIRCLGEIEGRVYVVVYTWRGPNRRIISARKGNEKEARDYYSHDREGGTSAS